MYPRILHLYGPLWINSYGAMIALGFVIFVICALNDRRRKALISSELFFDTLFVGLLAGIIGGRVLYILENRGDFSSNIVEIFYPWIGGFSILGTVSAVAIIVPLFLYYHSIRILPVLDLAALYAPLFQAIARIGCFLAGCCYGVIALENFPFSLTYFHPESLAPCGIALHPAQLYSSGASLSLFFILRFFLSKIFVKPGQIAFLYLIGESVARFCVDFWRAERVLYGDLFLSLSFNQYVAVILCIVGIIAFGIVTFSRKKTTR